LNSIYKTFLENYKNERMRSFVFWFAVLIGTDQVLKYFVFKHATPPLLLFIGPTPVVGLQQFYNFNFAFSIPLPSVMMYMVYAVVVTLIGLYLRKNFGSFNKISTIAWALIVAGALSNIVERIALGYVRDFLYIVGGGVLNTADVFIIVGIVVLLVVEYQQKHL
jgi:signal peptidase II